MLHLAGLCLIAIVLLRVAAAVLPRRTRRLSHLLWYFAVLLLGLALLAHGGSA
jgi:uncharacterized membrane protein YoaK (UPF0700 family)